MASKRLTLADVTDLQQKDLDKMTLYELRKVLAPIRDATNKRVKAIREVTGGATAPSILALEKSGGVKLSTKNKDKAELLREINRGLAFISYKTSTKEKARQWIQQRDSGEGVKYSDMSNSQIGEYWNILHKLKQNGVQVSPEEYSDLNQLIRKAIIGKNPVQSFLMQIPKESWGTVKNHSMMAGDSPEVRKKMKTAERRTYYQEKIAKMIEVYSDWNVGLYSDEDDELF